MVTHSSILAWRIPWTEEPGELQSMGSERVRHDWSTNTFSSQKAPCRSHPPPSGYIILSVVSFPSLDASSVLWGSLWTCSRLCPEHRGWCLAGDKHSIGISERTNDPLSYMRKLAQAGGYPQRSPARGHWTGTWTQVCAAEVPPSPSGSHQGHKSADARAALQNDASSRRSNNWTGPTTAHPYISSEWSPAGGWPAAAARCPRSAQTPRTLWAPGRLWPTALETPGHAWSGRPRS